MSRIEVKSPGECSTAEICDFVDLVVQGGEVEAGGLSQRVMDAEQLAFLRVDGQLVGVAAIKNPNDRYRARVARASGFTHAKDAFPYELGWVFVTPVARGKGYAHSLAEAAISLVSADGVLATSRLENIVMHRVLIKLGFVPSGSTYRSTHGEHQLQLFTRAPRRTSFQ
ncbi:GNAT family N-acetyltransferase [Pseudomonas chlororaphis]|uniref:GNAT family N-acetyltransferase n=1 Tax=Pseudomonas chlororaphis TaxID=587753 RepID=UPI0015DD7FBB|nr:GNAT family N-acetyltransferase [Pseudomonas chlororaphis]QLL11105.1 GNAT family N-acetyltransferase [Pseudomonas chlororaphis subsp. aurantiaca]